MENSFHRVDLLLLKQADFYFGLCCFSPLRQFYCIIRCQNRQWIGLTVWARTVSSSHSSLCECVVPSLSGFLTAHLNLFALASSCPQSNVCKPTHWTSEVKDRCVLERDTLFLWRARGSIKNSVILYFTNLLSDSFYLSFYCYPFSFVSISSTQCV